MEVEIKLHVLPHVAGGPASLFAHLRKLERLAGYALGESITQQVDDIYFDAADGALARAGAGLRLRLEDGQALVTLKMDRRQEGALSTREEYEEPLSAQSLARILAHVRHLIGPEAVPLEPFAAGEAAGPLRPVLQVKTRRLARSVGGLATLTLDQVDYPGLAPESCWDIEVEALSGTDVAILRAVEAALYQEAAGALAGATISKLERGLRMVR